jgi:hypothetical protein
MSPLGKVFDGSTSVFEIQRAISNYRTRHMGVAVHAFTARSTAFRLCTTSGVFTIFMLRPYRAISCLYRGNAFSSLYGGRILHMPSIRSKKHFRHLGASHMKENEFTTGSFDFRFKRNGYYDHFPDYSTYKISYEVVTLTFQQVLVDASHGLLVSFMHIFCSVHLGK